MHKSQSADICLFSSENMPDSHQWNLNVTTSEEKTHRAASPFDGFPPCKNGRLVFCRFRLKIWWVHESMNRFHFNLGIAVVADIGVNLTRGVLLGMCLPYQSWLSWSCCLIKVPFLGLLLEYVMFVCLFVCVLFATYDVQWLSLFSREFRWFIIPDNDRNAHRRTPI